ncbi:cytochrome b5 domain-containing protein [Clostridium brassicae]|uniref:Cytochrome b5 heme-binding domain-containing protein n=1 Tax=Clostridium brassicae TaxID=2999072 RepID=A0ABT4D6Z0_9CLOT|nr:cytochrome b5 domain-containing protein [Clostridium brassicae]MCY6958059.1 hypothetical protein [Clostridium brassicae]
MDCKACKKLINRMKQNIDELQNIRYMSSNLYEKMFYDSLIQQEMYKINVLKNFLCNMRDIQNEYEDMGDIIDGENLKKNYMSMRQRVFTLDELAKYDGEGDNAAYIAIDGIVYDVTYEAAWAGGTHLGLKAGNDLSEQMNSCHDKDKILRNLKQVGILQK